MMSVTGADTDAPRHTGADASQHAGAGAPSHAGAGASGHDDTAVAEHAPGFGERGRMRRRARFLRKARELAYRDLGGLVFDLHRFGGRNDQVLNAKLATLRQIDTELRELEKALAERRGVAVLREVGIAACPRCAAIHGRDDRFCPGCGLAFDAHADRPLATAPMSVPTHTPLAQERAPAPQIPAAPAHTAEAQAQATAAQSPVPPPQTASTPASAPPVKPTAQPVAARPPSQPSGTQRQDRSDREEPAPPGDEDEPTQILRPPVRGG